MAKKIYPYELQDALNLKLALEDFQKAYYEILRLQHHIHNQEILDSSEFKEVQAVIAEMPDYREIIGPLDDRFSHYLQTLYWKVEG